MCPLLLLLLLTHLVPATHRLLVDSLLLGYCWRGAIASSSHWGCLGGGCHVESFTLRGLQPDQARRSRLGDQAKSRVAVHVPGLSSHVRQRGVQPAPLCVWMQGRFNKVLQQGGSHQLSLAQLTHRLL